jgi:ethanolamine ammonia-lyase large subunit/ethanolamine ammonia-lyase small subunit
VLVLAHQGRVAIADPIGEILRARITVMVIGERPGLSAADSLGVYITCDPAIGTPDSRRNCISNVREGGLPIARAADETLALILAMRRTGVSGVGLKDALARLSGPGEGHGTPGLPS